MHVLTQNTHNMPETHEKIIKILPKCQFLSKIKRLSLTRRLCLSCPRRLLIVHLPSLCLLWNVCAFMEQLSQRSPDVSVPIKKSQMAISMARVLEGLKAQFLCHDRQFRQRKKCCQGLRLEGNSPNSNQCRRCIDRLPKSLCRAPRLVWPQIAFHPFLRASPQDMREGDYRRQRRKGGSLRKSSSAWFCLIL